jgi:hypothetical protein
VVVPFGGSESDKDGSIERANCLPVVSGGRKIVRLKSTGLEVLDN